MEGKWLRRPSNGTSVVFLHGVLSDGETCWRHENGTHWPKLLEQEDTLKNVGIYQFTYKTGFFSGAYRLGDVVDAFSEHAKLDGILDSQKITFVCHSMGGIVARKFVVSQAIDLIDRRIQVGFFLLASPSLGSDYANWLKPLARLFGHTQADALRFSQTNSWLLDLDKEFLNLKESGRIEIQGKELVEDSFVVMKAFIRKQVVTPMSGARYFGDPFKVPDSDHSSISKLPDDQAIQHRLLLKFLGDFDKKNEQHTSHEPKNQNTPAKLDQLERFQVEQVELNSGNTLKCRIFSSGSALTYSEVLELWKSDQEFVEFYISIFEKSGLRGYVMEVRPVSLQSVEDEFEFVIHSTPRSSGIADQETYKQYFDITEAPEGIVSFDNLGGDAVLVVPSPFRAGMDYSGLPQFFENAPQKQKNELWRQVSRQVSERISEKPLWVSVAGGGIFWLHIRLDSSPKYYRYSPYTDLS